MARGNSYYPPSSSQCNKPQVSSLWLTSLLLFTDQMMPLADRYYDDLSEKTIANVQALKEIQLTISEDLDAGQLEALITSVYAELVSLAKSHQDDQSLARGVYQLEQSMQRLIVNK